MFFTSDVASSYSETALPQPELLPPLGCTSHRIQPCVGLSIRMVAVMPWYLLGFVRRLMPLRGWVGQFSPSPNRAHPTTPEWLAPYNIQRVAPVQENIIRPLTWLELCVLGRFMLMKRFLWLRRIKLIAPKLNWKWDIRIICTGERMRMINCPGSLDIRFRPDPEIVFFCFGPFC